MEVESSLALVSTDDTSCNEGAFIPLPAGNGNPRRMLLKSVISSFQTKCKLNLRTIATRARNAEFNSKQSYRCFIRLRSPCVTATVFSAGRVSILGATSLPDAKLAAKKIARLIQRAEHPNVRFTEFKIENICASYDFGYPVRLESLARKHRAYCTYEPEISPCLFFRLEKSKKLLIQCWTSGKVIITGTSCIEDMQKILIEFASLVSAFQT